MKHYSKLNDTFFQRRLFNPASRKDLKELRYFLANDKWETACPFYVEFPWESVPTMCLQKYTVHTLSKMKLG